MPVNEIKLAIRKGFMLPTLAAEEAIFCDVMAVLRRKFGAAIVEHKDSIEVTDVLTELWNNIQEGE